MPGRSVRQVSMLEISQAVARIDRPAKRRAHKCGEEQDAQTEVIHPIGFDKIREDHQRQQADQHAQQRPSDQFGQFAEEACEVKGFEPASTAPRYVLLEFLLFNLWIAHLNLAITDPPNAVNLILSGHRLLPGEPQ